MLKKLSLVILLFQIATFADDFTIRKFTASEAGEPNSYISSAFSDELKKAKGGKVSSGKFYVRQKFEDPYDPDAITYQLYVGQQTDAVGTLSKFKLPKGINIGGLVKKKFYLSENAEYDEDVEVVFFDKYHAYVEAEEEVYIKNGGKFVLLKYLDEKVCYIEITSEPSGAKVFVGDRQKGTTPAKFSVISSNAIDLTIKKTGYYSTHKTIKPNPSSVTQDGILLVKKKEMPDPTSALSAQLLQLEDDPDYDKLKQLSRDISKSLKALPQLVKETKSEIEDNYPSNPDQKAGETSSRFKKRTQSWKKSLRAELVDQDESGKEYKTKLKRLLKKSNKLKEDFRKLEAKKKKAEARKKKREAKIAAKKAKAEAKAAAKKEKAEAKAEAKKKRAEAKRLEAERFTIRYQAISSKYITLGKYRRGKFSYEIDIDRKPFRFSYKGSFKKGKADKNDILDSDDELVAIIKYWNVLGEDGHYNTLHDVDMFFQNKKFSKSRRKKGKFSFLEVDADAIKVGKKYNSKLKKKLKSKTKKRAFYKKEKGEIKIALKKVNEFPESDFIASEEDYEDEKKRDDAPVKSIKTESDKLIASENKKSQQEDEFKESFDEMDELYESSEVPFYTAVVLGLASVGTGAYALYLNSEANTAFDSRQVAVEFYKANVLGNPDNQDKSFDVDGTIMEGKTIPDYANEKGDEYQDKVKKAQIFGIISGLTLVGSIVLFTF